MKTKLILLSTILLFSCKQQEYNLKYKFKSGDKVYIKLDNRPCIIQRQANLDSIPSYLVFFMNRNEYQTEYIYEYNLIKNKNEKN